MKALLSASKSVSRSLLRHWSTKKRCVTATAVASGGRRSVCASHRSNIIDIDVSRRKKIITTTTNRQSFRISHPCRRLMGTSAQEHGDINVAVQAANER